MLTGSNPSNGRRRSGAAIKIRAYLDALRLVREPLDDAQSPAMLKDWMSWIEQHLRETDPLADVGKLVPSVPTPSPNDLVPFLTDGVRTVQAIGRATISNR